MSRTTSGDVQQQGFEILRDRAAELYAALEGALRQHVFDNVGRLASVRALPAASQTIVDLFLQSLVGELAETEVFRQVADLVDLGLGPRPALAAIDRLAWAGLEMLEANPEQVRSLRPAVAAFRQQFELGYIQARTDEILTEQERIHRGLTQTLEKQVVLERHLRLELQRRQSQLQTAVQISRAASSILDLDELLRVSVDLIRERFDLYYVGLFWVDQDDEDREWAILRAGTGKAGREMLRQGFKLKVDERSMVGWCITHNQIRIALDTSQETVRIDHPLLPETRSEMALPLVSRGQVSGAMTIQSDHKAAFSDEDMVAFEALAGQLANAIQNARLFEQVQTALQELEAAQQRYVGQAWQAYATAEKAIQGYQRTATQAGPTADAWLPAMTTALRQHDVVVEQDEEGGGMLALPLTLHDEVIGALGGYSPTAEGWSQEEVEAAKTIVEQMVLALESQRLFDEEQQARAMLDIRVNELDALNDLGRKIDESPPIDEFLAWVAGRIPAAMQFPELAVAAIQFNGDVYGAPQALELPCQMVQSLLIGGEQVGHVYIAYREQRDFLNEESALLGDIARRVSGYVENRRLLQETQRAAQELEGERSLLRTLIDSIPGYIYVKDRQSRFLINNKAHLRVLGVDTQEEVLGKTDFDIFPEENAAQYYADEQELMRSGQPLFGREEQVVDPATGEIQWVMSTKVPLRDAAGEVYGFVGLTLDITERKRAEETLERRRAQLQVLSDIGQQIGESPPVGEFLQWVAERIPTAMQYPELCRVAIESESETYGSTEARELPRHIVQSMSIGGRRVGRVIIAYTEDHDFLDEESALLGDIVRRISGYIENQRLFDETQRRAERLAVINRVAGAAGASLQLDELFETVYEEIASSFEHDAAFMALYDQDARELEFLFAMERGERLAPERTPLGGFSSIVVEEKRPLCIRNFEEEREQLPTPVTIGDDKIYAAWLGVPMVSGEQVIGLVCVMDDHPNAYGQEEELLLSTIADQVAGAIERTRLFDEVRGHAEELAILNDMSRTLTGLLNVDDVLEEAYRAAAQLLDATRFSVALYDEEKDEFAVALHVIDGEMQKYVVTRKGASGISGYILAHREPVLIRENVREWQIEHGIKVEPFGGTPPPLCWLGVPLLVGERVLGTMFVQSLTTPHLYDEHDREMMVAIATQVASTLENARLFEETQAALAEVEAAHRSYLRTQWQDHLRQREILERSGFLYDRFQADRQAELIAMPDLWRPEMEQAITAGSPATILDRSEEGERAGMAIPITVRGQLIGVLGVESPAADRQWSENDLALIQAVGEQLGQTLESARLFADTQRRAERERLIGEITAKIRASTDIPRILETAATELGQVLGTSRALVRLGLTEEQGNEK